MDQLLTARMSPSSPSTSPSCPRREPHTVAAATWSSLHNSTRTSDMPAMKRPNSAMTPGTATEYPTVHPKSPELDKDRVEHVDVLVVGAGPAGLMLATNLTRYGISTKIIDDRPGATMTGRADGLQPKSIETFKQLRLADSLLQRGVKVYDITFWSSSPDQPKLHRSGREIHYPPLVDVLEPYVLLVHQGMVEQVFLDDMKARGLEVERNAAFESYELKEDPQEEYPIEAVYMDTKNSVPRKVKAKYMVGCDGAHSAVRRSMPGVEMEGESEDVFWGVLDGEVETDFPDLWSKCAISSHTAGTILCIPRERNMTRLYIELTSSTPGQKISRAIANQAFVQSRAKEILAPYKVKWTSIDWFGVYQIGQRMTSSFTHSDRVFLAGDAAHTHSPKAAQGMNVSMHDTFNLAWKLWLVLSNMAPRKLLETYTEERRKIADDLITFDQEHARAFIANDAKALAENFKTNIRFISGVGAVYRPNTLNLSSPFKYLPVGELPPPARAVRYVDSNPVDIQLDIPILGQFRLYFIAPCFPASSAFLDAVCEGLSSRSSLLARVSAASRRLPKPPRTDQDSFLCPERYMTSGRIFTPALITKTPQDEMELEDMPPMIRDARWTVYIDMEDEVGKGGLADVLNVSEGVFRKWGLEDVKLGEMVVAVVRPDGYVGAVGGPWQDGSEREAVDWVEGYFNGILC